GQIAGNSTLVVTQTATRGSMAGGQGNGPIWGGIPGTGGGPQRLPGNGGSAGTGPGVEGPLEAKVEAGPKSDKVNPLLAVLKDKVLPEKEITEPVSGLLYFQIEGKLKPKDLELYYKTPGAKRALRFRP